MREKEISVLSSSPLFCSCTTEEIQTLLERSGAERITFSSGEEIPFRERNSRIGILLSGKARVFSAEAEKTPLNLLMPGSLFGISSLYADEDPKTRVIAATGGAKFLFIDETNLGILLEHAKIRTNLIAHLTNRIRFLTEKIASFTAAGAEAKLARYLLGKAGGNCLAVSVSSYASLARSLNVGRASLYRALEELERSGAIRKEGKQVHILSPEKLQLF